MTRAITADDLSRWQGYLTKTPDYPHGDRASFYLEYYEVTGNQQMLALAQISSFSGTVGKTALVANYIDAQVLGARYHPGGVEEFSLDIAKAIYNRINNNYSDKLSGILRNSDVVDIASDVWKTYGIEDYFPQKIFVLLAAIEGNPDYIKQHSSDWFTPGFKVSLGSAPLGALVEAIGIQGDAEYNSMYGDSNTNLGYTQRTSSDGSVTWQVDANGRAVMGSVNASVSYLLPQLTDEPRTYSQIFNGYASEGISILKNFVSLMEALQDAPVVVEAAYGLHTGYVNTTTANNQDGTSTVTLQRPDKSTYTGIFSGADGSGLVLNTNLETADGKSQVRLYDNVNNTCSTSLFGGPNGTGNLITQQNEGSSISTVILYNSQVQATTQIYSNGGMTQTNPDGTCSVFLYSDQASVQEWNYTNSSLSSLTSTSEYFLTGQSSITLIPDSSGIWSVRTGDNTTDTCQVISTDEPELTPDGTVKITNGIFNYTLNPYTGDITLSQTDIAFNLTDGSTGYLNANMDYAVIDSNGVLNIQSTTSNQNGTSIWIKLSGGEGIVLDQNNNQTASFHEEYTTNSDGSLTSHTIITRSPSANPNISVNQSWQYFYSDNKLFEVDAYQFNSGPNSPWATAAGRFYWWSSTYGVLLDNRASMPNLSYTPDLSGENNVFNVNTNIAQSIELGSRGDRINYGSGAGNLDISATTSSAPAQIYFDQSLSSAELIVDQLGNLEIDVAGSGTITIDHALSLDSGTVNSQIQTLHFSDGSAINLQATGSP